VQVLGKRWDRDVEAGVADEDDQQAEAQDGERPPPSWIRGSEVWGGV